MDYETVIGLEVHVQLKTQSKMFCSCRADYQTAPANSHVCPVCLGLPGTLPVINKKAVEFTIMMGLALGCEIPSLTKFDRKNYPYPDLMKGYQISQFDMPLALNGQLDITTDGVDRCVRVERVHLEEDVAKLQHVNGDHSDAHSLVDVNRSGVPLMEVVSHPDMRTPEEARSYLTKLHLIIQYLGVSTANAQDGSFRCDANISLRPVGQEEYGTKAEIKNMNSLRAVFMALNHEQERQRKVLESGERVIQETRGWSEERNATYSQRSKEEAHDYRYFPEPDLPPVVVDQAWIEEIRSKIPQLPVDRLRSMMDDYGLPEYDARLLTNSKAMADFYEQAARLRSTVKDGGGEAGGKFAKDVSNWILGDLSRLLNLQDLDIKESPVSPEHLAELIGLVDQDTISVSMAKTVLEEAFETGGSPAQIVQEKGYTQISDSSAVDLAVSEAIEANPQAVADYVGGKETAAKFLVGQVMKITKGQAKPDLVNELVASALEKLK